MPDSRQALARRGGEIDTALYGKLEWLWLGMSEAVFAGKNLAVGLAVSAAVQAVLSEQDLSKTGRKEDKRMETYRGSGHLPGTPKTLTVELDVDWAGKEAEVRIPGLAEGVTQWPGLMVQTIGKDEAVFRTKGIPPLGTHWWHAARNSGGDLATMVLALPGADGMWGSCTLLLKRIL
ncbi:MAG: hypothetical protein V1737_03225 [Chloroflexota bacterium]